MQQEADEANREEKLEMGLLEREAAMTEEPPGKAAAGIARKEEEEDRERKVLALTKGFLGRQVLLPAVHIIGPQGLLLHSFCITC